MSNELATRDREIALASVPEHKLSEAIEAALANNDLSKLTTQDRVQWYNHRCRVAGLDPSTRPFIYITLNGKLTMYATKECGELLNGKHGISHKLVSRETVDGVHIVTVTATTSGGRQTTDIGAIPVQGLRGADLANALMKTFTKAKRRATLSLCGLGDVLDVCELDTVDYRECDDGGKSLPPKNNSGFGRGQYASPEQSERFQRAMQGYLDKRNAQWLDSLQNKFGEIPPGAKDICNLWQADNHLIKWAKETGRLDPASCDANGVKNRQIGRYTAIVYCRSEADQKALAKELERYINEQCSRQLEAIELQRGEQGESDEAAEDAALDALAAKHRAPESDPDVWPAGRE